ncbi:MAG: rhomboid family intramembrane serine protease [Cytophagaceae bacterium]
MSEAEDQQNPESGQVKPTKLADVVKFLVIANVIAYIALNYFLAQDDPFIFEEFALYNFQSENFSWYQLITHMFLHAGFLHIFLNMFILWMFGSALEYIWKPKRFIFYYFFTGLGAAFLHLAVSTFTIGQLESDVRAYQASPSYENYEKFLEEEVGEVPDRIPVQAEFLNDMYALKERWESAPDNKTHKEESKDLTDKYLQFHIDRPSLGASGAVFGILLAFGMLFPNTLIYLWFLFPIRAKYFVIFLGALELYLGVFDDGNVANFAHLGGMIFGFILLKIWGEKPRNEGKGLN